MTDTKGNTYIDFFGGVAVCNACMHGPDEQSVECGVCNRYFDYCRNLPDVIGLKVKSENLSELPY